MEQPNQAAPRAGSQKTCPKCDAKVGNRKKRCACGHLFLTKQQQQMLDAGAPEGPVKRPREGLDRRTEDPFTSARKIAALLDREAEVNRAILDYLDRDAEAGRIMKLLKDANVDAAAKQKIRDRFTKIHQEWVNAYEESERKRGSRARGRRGAPVGLLEQFQQSFTITGVQEDFVENDTLEEWLQSTNQTKGLQQLKNDLKRYCQDQNPPVVIDTSFRINSDYPSGIRGIKKIEVVVEPATIPSADDYVGVSDGKLRDLMRQNRIPCPRTVQRERDKMIATLVERRVVAPLEDVSAEEAAITTKTRELSAIARRLLETGDVLVPSTIKGNQREKETSAVFLFVIPAAQSQFDHCIKHVTKNAAVPTVDELKAYFLGKIDALDYLPDAECEQLKKCVRDASADLAPVMIVKRCAELNLELCGGCQNIAAIRERRKQGNVKKAEFERQENLCVNRRESQEALEAGVVLRRVHEAIADELKTYEKSVLQGVVDRGASLEDRLRPRARFAVQHEHEVRAKASAGRDLGPANRAWLKAARKMNWTGRKHTAQGNNDPHTRRVRVLTDRMRSTVHIRDL